MMLREALYSGPLPFARAVTSSISSMIAFMGSTDDVVVKGDVITFWDEEQ